MRGKVEAVGCGGALLCEEAWGAALPPMLDRAAVLRVLALHHADVGEFDERFGWLTHYRKGAVLTWLGY